MSDHIGPMSPGEGLHPRVAELEVENAELKAKLEAMKRAGMALIAGCEAPDWRSWYEAVNEWRALVAAAQEEPS